MMRRRVELIFRSGMHCGGQECPPCMRGHRSGFTLIEVMATIVLLGIVMPAVMMGISASLGAASQAKRSVEAAMLGETKLNELVVTGQWQNGVLSGDFAPDSPDYKWQAQQVARDMEITELDLRVTWIARGQERSVNLSTMVYTSTTSTTGSSGTSGAGR